MPETATTVTRIIVVSARRIQAVVFEIFRGNVAKVVVGDGWDTATAKIRVERRDLFPRPSVSRHFASFIPFLSLAVTAPPDKGRNGAKEDNSPSGGEKN